MQKYTLDEDSDGDSEEEGNAKSLGASDRRAMMARIADLLKPGETVAKVR